MLFGRYVNKYYLKYWYYFILGIIALVAVDYFQLQIPEIYGNIIDGLNGNIEFNREILLDYIKNMFLITAVMVAGRFSWRICIFGVAIRIETDLREQMFGYTKDLSQDFYQENKTGAMMALYINDLHTIRMCFGNGVVMLIDALFLGILALIKMFSLSVSLTLISCVPLVIMAICGGIIGKYMNRKWRIRQEAFEEMSDFVQESFSGISVIRAFVKETKELLAFSKINKKNEQKNVEFVKASTLLNVLIGILIQSVMIIILGYGSYLVINNANFSSGNLITYIGYFSSVTWPMMAIARLINMVSQGNASLKRVSDLLDHKVTVKDGPSVKPLENPKGEITYNHLNFKYKGAQNDVLSDINFTIPAGTSLGVLGKTGSGKTTLVELLLRLHNLEPDQLLIDGVDIMRIPLKQVREMVSFVPQDNFLFSEKIRNNIAFAFKDADIEEVQKFAALADVSDDIEDFPDKYDTILGERGVTVSGGQKQRISIARALMKDANVLILDDSVSAVDTKTEEKILDNLKEIRQGKTTILVAHRISTVKDLDKIVLLEDGKVIAIGNHQELLETSQEYRKMVEMQQLEDEIGGEVNG